MHYEYLAISKGCLLEKFKALLMDVQVEQWLAVQNMWMYMEAVFSSGDIVKQLPIEARRFQNIDKSFMKVSCIEALRNVSIILRAM